MRMHRFNRRICSGSIFSPHYLLISLKLVTLQRMQWIATGVGSTPQQRRRASRSCCNRHLRQRRLQQQRSPVGCSSPVEKSEDGCRGRDPRWDQTDCSFCQRFPHSRRITSVSFRSQSFFQWCALSHRMTSRTAAAARLIATSRLIAVRRRL